MYDAAQSDITTINALNVLNENEYDCEKALDSIVNTQNKYVSFNKKWSEEDRKKFNKGFLKHGKNFFKIRKEFLSSKETSDLVEYYYFWKKFPTTINNKQIYRRLKRPLSTSSTNTNNTCNTTNSTNNVNKKQNTSSNRLNTKNNLNKQNSGSINNGNSNSNNSSNNANHSRTSGSDSESENNNDSDEETTLSNPAIPGEHQPTERKQSNRIQQTCSNCSATSSKEWHCIGESKIYLCYNCKVYNSKKFSNTNSNMQGNETSASRSNRSNKMYKEYNHQVKLEKTDMNNNTDDTDSTTTTNSNNANNSSEHLLNSSFDSVGTKASSHQNYRSSSKQIKQEVNSVNKSSDQQLDATDKQLISPNSSKSTYSINNLINNTEEQSQHQIQLPRPKSSNTPSQSNIKQAKPMSPNPASLKNQLPPSSIDPFIMMMLMNAAAATGAGGPGATDPVIAAMIQKELMLQMNQNPLLSSPFGPTAGLPPPPPPIGSTTSPFLPPTPPTPIFPSSQSPFDNPLMFLNNNGLNSSSSSAFQQILNSSSKSPSSLLLNKSSNDSLNDLMNDSFKMQQQALEDQMPPKPISQIVNKPSEYNKADSNAMFMRVWDRASNSCARTDMEFRYMSNAKYLRTKNEQKIQKQLQNQTNSNQMVKAPQKQLQQQSSRSNLSINKPNNSQVDKDLNNNKKPMLPTLPPLPPLPPLQQTPQMPISGQLFNNSPQHPPPLNDLFNFNGKPNINSSYENFLNEMLRNTNKQQQQQAPLSPRAHIPFQLPHPNHFSSSSSSSPNPLLQQQLTPNSSSSPILDHHANIPFQLPMPPSANSNVANANFLNYMNQLQFEKQMLSNLMMNETAQQPSRPPSNSSNFLLNNKKNHNGSTSAKNQMSSLNKQQAQNSSNNNMNKSFNNTNKDQQNFLNPFLFNNLFPSSPQQAQQQQQQQQQHQLSNFKDFPFPPNSLKPNDLKYLNNFDMLNSMSKFGPPAIAPQQPSPSSIESLLKAQHQHQQQQLYDNNQSAAAAAIAAQNFLKMSQQFMAPPHGNSLSSLPPPPIPPFAPSLSDEQQFRLFLQLQQQQQSK